MIRIVPVYPATATATAAYCCEHQQQLGNCDNDDDDDDESRGDTAKAIKNRNGSFSNKSSSRNYISSSDAGTIFSLPATLGRFELALAWWKYCPNGCRAHNNNNNNGSRGCDKKRSNDHDRFRNYNGFGQYGKNEILNGSSSPRRQRRRLAEIARPQPPCRQYCHVIRRKDNLYALSKAMVTFSATTAAAATTAVSAFVVAKKNRHLIHWERRNGNDSDKKVVASNNAPGRIPNDDGSGDGGTDNWRALGKLVIGPSLADSNKESSSSSPLPWMIFQVCVYVPLSPSKLSTITTLLPSLLSPIHRRDPTNNNNNNNADDEDCPIFLPINKKSNKNVMTNPTTAAAATTTATAAVVTPGHPKPRPPIAKRKTTTTGDDAGRHRRHFSALQKQKRKHGEWLRTVRREDRSLRRRRRRRRGGLGRAAAAPTPSQWHHQTKREKSPWSSSSSSEDDDDEEEEEEDKKKKRQRRKRRLFTLTPDCTASSSSSSTTASSDDEEEEDKHNARDRKKDDYNITAAIRAAAATVQRPRRRRVMLPKYDDDDDDNSTMAITSPQATQRTKPQIRIRQCWRQQKRRRLPSLDNFAATTAAANTKAAAKEEEEEESASSVQGEHKNAWSLGSSARSSGTQHQGQNQTLEQRLAFTATPLSSQPKARDGNGNSALTVPTPSLSATATMSPLKSQRPLPSQDDLTEQQVFTTQVTTTMTTAAVLLPKAANNDNDDDDDDASTVTATPSLPSPPTVSQRSLPPQDALAEQQIAASSTPLSKANNNDDDDDASMATATLSLPLSAATTPLASQSPLTSLNDLAATTKTSKSSEQANTKKAAVAIQGEQKNPSFLGSSSSSSGSFLSLPGQEVFNAFSHSKGNSSENFVVLPIDYSMHEATQLLWDSHLRQHKNGSSKQQHTQSSQSSGDLCHNANATNQAPITTKPRPPPVKNCCDMSLTEWKSLKVQRSSSSGAATANQVSFRRAMIDLVLAKNASTNDIRHRRDASGKVKSNDATTAAAEPVWLPSLLLGGAGRRYEKDEEVGDSSFGNSDNHQELRHSIAVIHR